MALPSYPFWPADVPWQALLPSGYSEEIQDNKISFEPDAGVAIERPRTTMAIERISYTSVGMTGDQLEQLKLFYRDTLRQGSAPMLRYHPRRGSSVVIVAKFSQAPNISRVIGSDSLNIGVALIKLPSAYD